ncbi:MAG: restriction endonuclease subunit S [Lysobacterales bacterium]
MYTEVGPIPTGWEVVAAKDACALVVDCKNRTPPMVLASEFAVVRTPNVRNGQFLTDGIRFTDEASYREWTARAVPQPGDILITREAPLGEVCAVPTGLNVCLGQRMMLYRPMPGRTDSAYLLFALMSWPVRANLLRKIGGSTVGHARVDDIRFLQFPLPPLPEQRAIAAALSDIDALLAGLDRLIAKKRDLKQAAMQQLLTGQTRLPGFQGEWESTALADIATTPITDGPHLTPTFLPAGVPFLSVNNLVGNRLDFSSLRFISEADHAEFSKKCKPRRGDILFGKAASVGMVGLVETDVEFNIWSPLALIRVVGKMDERFVFYALQGSSVARQIKLLTNSSSQGNIGMSDIGLLRIPKPLLPEQEAIATILSDMDAELAALEARRDKTHMLKQGMMQELLTGRTRLI